MRRTIEEIAKSSFLEWSTGEYMRLLTDLNTETYFGVD
jgi:hypothetical protein